MMLRIVETVVITLDAGGAPHLAPLGLTEEPDGQVSAAPFHPSRTLDNLRARPCFTASVPSDPRVFAGLLTGRRAWPTLPAATIAGHYLAGATSHREYRVVRCDDDPVRPRFHAELAHEAMHAPALPFNRAAGALIEAAILVSRLHLLPAGKVAAERAYLQIAIDRTAGPAEREAWGWLTERMDAHLNAHLPAGPQR